MIGAAWKLLALAALTMTAVLTLELRAGVPTTQVAAAGQVDWPRVARARAPNEDAVDHTDAGVRRVLARPVFSRDRRPTPVVAVAAGAATVPGLPRLAGVMVGPFGRTAIFADDANGKPRAVGPGARIGVYTVEAIQAGEVTVAGPDGMRQLQPSFDTKPPAVVAAAPPRPQFIGGGARFHQEVTVREATRLPNQGTE